MAAGGHYQGARSWLKPDCTETPEILGENWKTSLGIQHPNNDQDDGKRQRTSTATKSRNGMTQRARAPKKQQRQEV